MSSYIPMIILLMMTCFLPFSFITNFFLALIFKMMVVLKLSFTLNHLVMGFMLMSMASLQVIKIKAMRTDSMLLYYFLSDMFIYIY